jgi:hypothetical protein
VTVCVAGVAMWLVARLIGSGGLELVGIGFALLPVVAGVFLRLVLTPSTGSSERWHTPRERLLASSV